MLGLLFLMMKTICWPSSGIVSTSQLIVNRPHSGCTIVLPDACTISIARPPAVTTKNYPLAGDSR
jgi:hypothetical protein